jgi:hypothetical protein
MTLLFINTITKCPHGLSSLDQMEKSLGIDRLPFSRAVPMVHSSQSQILTLVLFIILECFAPNNHNYDLDLDLFPEPEFDLDLFFSTERV